jgi:hypothetical protein
MALEIQNGLLPYKDRQNAHPKYLFCFTLLITKLKLSKKSSKKAILTRILGQFFGLLHLIIA